MINKLDITPLLSCVSKPTRYLGNEVNSIHKDLSKDLVRVCLAFPDVYEIGLSHLGLKILYSILNARDDVAAERVYAPWFDAEEAMRKNAIPLFSLESRLPIKEFDILGFSLQYELSYTNILNMLNLAQIPLLSSARNEEFPLVIAGGPLSFNPEPLAEFIDLFCIGDGEEVILELIEVYKQNWHKPKSDLLAALSQIEGVYVPALYRVDYYEDGRIKEFSPKIPGVKEKIKKRMVTDLDKAPFPTDQIVPYMNIIHDRASLEIQRGCTQGCRFCHAGIIYRPIRERSLDCLLNQANELISKTGYEDLSLGSLSTSNYSSILKLVNCLQAQFGTCVSLSLPSLRINPLIPDISTLLAKIKHTGITLVPEVGTVRLQKVINKQVSIEELAGSIENIFQLGWRGVKLYFMIGLPQENYEDLDGIIHIIHKINKICKGRHTLKISLSSFVPKTHTPFQWTAQLPKEELIARQNYIIDKLPRKRVEVSWHDTNLSFLEAVFSRGDRRLCSVLLKAYELGCKFDGWNEYFDNDKWQKAFASTEIDPAFYANRAKDFDEILPWDHIDCGVTKDFLWQEYQNSLIGQETPDCKQTKRCTQCGLEKECSSQSPISNFQFPISNSQSPITNYQLPITKLRVRIEFTKQGDTKYISHLDLMRLLMRAIKRAKIPIAMSQGFNPHPRLALSHALAVGLASQAEYADMDLYRPMKLAELITNFNQVLPDGIKVLNACFIDLKAKSLTSLINQLVYKIEITDEDCLVESRIEELLAQEQIWILRVVKEREEKIDIRPYISQLTLNKQDGKIELLASFNIDNGKTVKMTEFINAFIGDGKKVVGITRVCQFYRDKQGNLHSPVKL
ncbi:MAG: TIGR03960 family B12-binding radical SAM protein [bacterium]|nr:TIGR03960 family B12-binding radical SAM protein [bacterium]